MLWWRFRAREKISTICTKCAICLPWSVYTEPMENTQPTIIEMYNIRTGKVIRTFTNRKTATKFCYLYNDLAGRTAFNTRAAK